MTAKECLMMLREIKDVAFATVDEDGEPQVRIIDVMLVDDDKLYFCTARGKDFYSQLTADGRVAVTGMNDKYQMVRLSGEAKKVEGQEEWIDKIFDNNPSMNDIYPGDSRYILEPFCIDNGRLEFFDLGRKPIFRETFVLGETLEAGKGFFYLRRLHRVRKMRSLLPAEMYRRGQSVQNTAGSLPALRTLP